MLIARKSDRVKSFLRAQIIFNHSMSTMDCIIKNISDHGARIALDEQLTVPGEFDLYVPQKSKTFRAKMVWRQADAIGVAFLDEKGQNFREDIPAEMRLRELELLNAELRARVRELSRRLEALGQDPNLAA